VEHVDEDQAHGLSRAHSHPIVDALSLQSQRLVLGHMNVVEYPSRRGSD
jgi:hypothetical protein